MLVVVVLTSSLKRLLFFDIKKHQPFILIDDDFYKTNTYFVIYIPHKEDFEPYIDIFRIKLIDDEDDSIFLLETFSLIFFQQLKQNRFYRRILNV